MTALTATSLKKPLESICGYDKELLDEDYRFTDGGPINTIPLAAFAHRPFDARSACIAVLDCLADPQLAVEACRAFGAPVVLVCYQGNLQWWKPGRAGTHQYVPSIPGQHAHQFLEKHKQEFSPSRLYDAKTRGRIPGSGRQLDFVDLGLLPLVESEAGDRLTKLVDDVIALLKAAFSTMKPNAAQMGWIVKSTFRLLAAKILKDKRVPGFISLNLGELQTVFQKVQTHYGSKEQVVLGNAKQRHALDEAGELVRCCPNLRHLTTEALADVYERALVGEETRKLLGIHATPSYLADYIIWQLAPWIEKLPFEQLRVFEPACGHAPFLVGMMRLIRHLHPHMPPEEMSRHFRKCLRGIEVDPFALEIARLSLTVADIPQPDGWDNLCEADMFADKALEDEARKAKVLLANPPYEGSKALRLLQRTLPNLPTGAVFGVVLPTGLLYTEKEQPVELRRWLIHNCQLAEVSLFPDKVFRYADQESAILLGRRLATARMPLTSVRCRRVREQDSEGFAKDYHFTTKQTCRQDRFAADAQYVPWVAEYDDEIWAWLEALPKLESITHVNQGLVHKGKKKLPRGTKTVSSHVFPNSVPGFATTRGKWMLHEQPRVVHLNLQKETIRRPGSGTETDRTQVLLNYAPASRGVWRLKPFIDQTGRPATSRFITVRPASDEYPLEYIWALCCSPLANAYLYVHSLKRDILVGTLRKMPVPEVCKSDIQRVVRAARSYLDAAVHVAEATKGSPRERMPLFAPASEEAGRRVGIAKLHVLLKRMDAEVLRLYDLPAKAERSLLDLFEGKVRPGVPGRFDRYYPQGFKPTVPLYAFLSDTYQRGSSSTKPLDIEAEALNRYHQLLDKQLDVELTEEDQEELERIEAELDGADFAVAQPSDAWLATMERKREHTRKRLERIASQLMDLTQETQANDHPT